MNTQLSFRSFITGMLLLLTVSACQTIQSDSQVKPSGARQGIGSPGDIGGPRTNALGIVYRHYLVSELVLLHSEDVLTRSASYSQIRNLTDDQLKASCTNPPGGDYVTVKSGTNTVLQGNTRVYELRRRGFNSFPVPCDTHQGDAPGSYGFYDM